MNVLCVDTSLSACHIALVVNGAEGVNLVYEAYEEMKHGHAVHLVPLIEDVLAGAGISYSEIDAFSVTKGPGSFTGIRVGLATVSAMALSLNKPVLGFSSLEVLALPHRKQDVVVAIDTRCGDFFTQAFLSGKGGEISCMTKEAIEMQYRGMPLIVEGKPDVLAWAAQVGQAVRNGMGQAFDMVPVYVKPPEAKRANYLPEIKWENK